MYLKKKKNTALIGGGLSQTIPVFGILAMFTGVVRHGRLLIVPLLLKLDVAQLENSGHHLEHPCSEEDERKTTIQNGA